MGNYFMMSTRFNKRSAQDFGLIPIGECEAINPKDGTSWIKTSLYDFGWGKENGFCKLPLPGFLELLNLVICSNCDEDAYGAAAVILDKYSDDLLYQCENIMKNPAKVNEFKRLIKFFDLTVVKNRSSSLKKNYSQIQNDFSRWRKISDIAKKL